MDSRSFPRAASAFLVLLAVGADASGAAAPPGGTDAIFLDGRFDTQDPARPQAQAIAVRAGRIVYVGDDAGAIALKGPKTRVHSLEGRRVLPGLVDAHIHPLATVDLDDCDLQSKPLTLAQMTAFVHSCIEHYHPPAGHWLSVRAWNFTEGNQADDEHPNLRTALDLAARDRPIQLLGNDEHHGAFNSYALALARDGKGRTVGLSRATLRGVLARLRALIGVDADGEPDGSVNDVARDSMGGPQGLIFVDMDAVRKSPEKVVERLNAAGITAVLDALVRPEMYSVYDDLLARERFTLRANLAQLYEPENFADSHGAIDYDAIVTRAKAVRAKYAGNPLVSADTVKVFADGILEGDPAAVPPTLPGAPALHPYLQPIFGQDDQGRPMILGYVDSGGPACTSVRDHPEIMNASGALEKFLQANGFHPDQCLRASGIPRHDPQVLKEYIRRMHAAGFTLHLHAIGDGTMHMALDAIEAARASDGKSDRPDAIAHAQLVSPEDVLRAGRDRIFIAMTFKWAYADPDYDVLVIPFIDRVEDTSFASLHNPANYYERQAYPARALADAGAILVAGSDAPVDTRDPQPFLNMQMAVTRALPGGMPLNPRQSIRLAEVVRAYTIDGARALRREAEIGSLAVGKSADFVILDRDIYAVPTESVGETKVLQTWFQGRKVFDANER